MTTKPNPANNTNNFFWDSEMLIGYINSTPTRKFSVSIATKGNNKFVVCSDLYKKKSEPWQVKKNFVAPFHTAQQIAALINRAIREGQKLGW